MTDWDESIGVFFEGAGGSTLGAIRAGFSTVGYERWLPAVETSRANGHEVVQIDLSDPANDELIRRHRVMWFSPPCQPFSAATAGAGHFDPRDGFPWMLRIVAARLPEVVFVENVKGLTFRKHRPYLRRIVEEFQALGYDVEGRVLNCADFGVPQVRERLIIVARRDGRRVGWPIATHSRNPGLFGRPWVPMVDALGWGMIDAPFPTVAGAGESGGFDPWGVGGAGAREKIRAARDEGRWVLDYRQTDGKRKEPITVDVTDRPAPTVGTQSRHQWIFTRPATTVGSDRRIHPPGHKLNAADVAAGRDGHDRAGSEAIRLTHAELAIIQGFPPDYVFCGGSSARSRQIGNAVPPALAEAVISANLSPGS